MGGCLHCHTIETLFNVLMCVQSRICLIGRGLRTGTVAVIKDDDAHMDGGRWMRHQLVALITTTCNIPVLRTASTGAYSYADRHHHRLLPDRHPLSRRDVDPDRHDHRCMSPDRHSLSRREVDPDRRYGDP